MSKTRIGWFSGRAIALAGVALLFVATPNCKKKEEGAKEKTEGKETGKKKEGDKADKGKTGEKARTAARARPAAAATVDAALQKHFADQFSAAKANTFDKLTARVNKSKSAIEGMGEKGKKLFPLLLAAAENLKKISKSVAEKKFDEIPAMVINGYIAGLVGVKTISTTIGSLGKKAAKAARSLNVKKAKKLAKYAKNLASPAKIAGEVLKVYVLILKAIMESKSDDFRVSTFAAGVAACAKADAFTKNLVSSALKKFHAGQPAGKAKEQMGTLLKKL